MKFYILSASYIILLILGYVIYTKYFKKVNGYVDSVRKIFPSIISSKALLFYRLSHSFVCLVLCFYLIELIPFTFYGQIKEGLSQNLILAKHIIWMIILSLIFLGTRYRFIYVINALFTFILLGSNVGDFMLKISSFWMIFIMPTKNLIIESKYLSLIGLDKKNLNHSENWAVFLLGLNLSFIITISGIFKLFDPVWLNGLGFYYCYIQPWMHVEWTSFILEYKWLMYSMNYVALAFEATPLFLFFFKKTRVISFFFMFCFIFLVNFPLRIDPVGPAGLVILIAVFSIIELRVPNIKLYKGR